MSVLLLSLKADALSEEQLARIREAAPDSVKILVSQDRNEIGAILHQVEIAAGWFPRDLIPLTANLRWFQQWSAGADWLSRYPEAAQMDFVLTNTSGIHAIQITEHVFAFLFAFARELPRAMRAQADHKWIPQDQHKHIFELADKTMVLVGVGAIGERTALTASAMGIRVLGIRRDPTIDVPGVKAMFDPDQLLELLPKADFVVLTVPLTEETQGMLGEDEFRAMKSTAYIINVGRGGTIDEHALVRALREEWIAGAGLDVFKTEPLPEHSPLWDLDHLIVTSHYAGLTPHYHERALEIFLENLQRYKAGRPLRNVVDKELGY